MNCIICNSTMEPGGIISEGVSTMWVPLNEFNKRGPKRLVYSGGKRLGTPNILIGQTRISNAFFCKKCNKVIGIFDAGNGLE